MLAYERILKWFIMKFPVLMGGMFTTSPSTAAVFQAASPSSKHSTNTRKHAAKSCDMADTEECPSQSLGPTFVESSTAQVSYLVRVPFFCFQW